MNKILLISLSNIGDAVLTTPVLEYLHNNYNDFEIDIVCDFKSFEVFKSCPYINNIYIKNKKNGLIGNIKLLFELRKNNYQIAVDLRTDIFLYFIKAKNKFFKIKNKNIHSVFKHFLSLKVEINKLPDLKIWIPENSMAYAKKLIGKRKKIIVFGIGANSDHKIWPTDNYLKLLEYLKDKFCICILLGDKRDNILAKDFVKKTKVKTLNFCGSLSLMDSAAIISQSDYFVGNDSGLGHISSALKIPTFIIFGKENVTRYHPWGAKSYWYQNPDKNIFHIKPDLIYKKIIKTI